MAGGCRGRKTARVQCRGSCTGAEQGDTLARICLYVDKSLSIEKQLLDGLTAMNNKGELQMEVVWAVALSADCNDWIVPIKWVVFKEDGTT